MLATSYRPGFVSTAILAAYVVALSLLLASSPAMAESQPPHISGRVDIRDVDAAALLFAVADAVNFNLVAPVPAGRERVSLSTDFSSIDELLQQLAGRVGLRGVVVGRRVLVLSPCLHSEARNSPPRAQGPLSIRLPDATLKEVFDLVSADGVAQGTQEDAALLSRRLVVRVINASREDIIQAVVAALGGELVDNPTLAGVANCSGVEKAPLSTSQLRSQVLRNRANHCPYRTEEVSRPCDPLEFFSLKDVFPRGYVEGLGRRSAFIEAPDGLLHVVKNGSYVGHDYGRVRDISRGRIELRELVIDSNNVWVESIVEMPHWAPPIPASPP